MAQRTLNEEKHMLNKRSLIKFAAIAGVGLMATACSSGSTTGTPAASGSAGASNITVAGVYENTQDAFWGTFVCGAKAKATELGINLKVSSIPTQDEGKLSTTLDTAMLSNPKAVIFNPIDTSPWSSKIQSIMNQGVPVVTASDQLKTQYAFVQAKQDGGVASDKVVDLVKGETGKAVLLNGLADAAWQHQRTDAIVSAVKTGAPGVTWLPNAIDGFDVNKGTQTIAGLITANPDLKLILAVAGPEGQAAAAAIKQTNMQGKIHVVAFDAVPAEVDALKAGAIDLLIAQPAYELGAQELQVLADYFKKNPNASGPVQPSTVSVQPALGVITKDNVDSAESKPFIYNPGC